MPAPARTPASAATAKHSPGPWRLHTSAHLHVVDVDGNGVASCGTRQRNYDIDALESEQEANARLISAAPDLLAALACAVDAAECGDPASDWLRQARAALAKAAP